MTLEQAKQLTRGTILYHVSNRNADGTPQRWRVNGKVKTWKRSPERVLVPVKHGLHNYDYLTERTLAGLTTDESEARTYTGYVRTCLNCETQFRTCTLYSEYCSTACSEAFPNLPDESWHIEALPVLSVRRRKFDL